MTTIDEKRRHVRSQGQTRNHHCHWPGCEAQVPPAMWGCKAHWFALPKHLRDAVWRTYVPGQEVDMTPSAAYLDVADEVQRWIREHGGGPVRADALERVAGMHTLALTLIQPWGTLVIHHGKPIENRSWAPGARLREGDRLWIHGGKSFDEDAIDLAFELVPMLDHGTLNLAPRGALLGHVRFDGIVSGSKSPWFFGPLGWKLSDPVPLATPIPCRGAQGLWNVPPDVLARAA